MLTVLEYFVQACRNHPQRPMFVRASGEEMTYAEVATRVYHGVECLDSMGLRRGDRVVGLLDETIPCALMLLACGFSRTLVTPLSPTFSPEYAASVAKLSSARAMVTAGVSSRLEEEIELPVLACAPEVVTPSMIGIVGTKGDLDDDSSAFQNTGSADRAIEELAKLSHNELTAPFLIQPTSGSTGLPKLVIRPHVAFSRYAHFVGDEVQKLGIEHIRVLAVNALTHAFAGHMFAMALRLGATLAVPTHLDFRASLGEIRKLEPNVLPMTPRVLQALFRQWQNLGQTDSIFRDSAKLMLSAGGRSEPSAVQSIKDQGIEFVEFYGSSEASLIALTPLGQHQPGTAGKVAPDVELKRNRNGELLVQSPGLMAGYYGDRELSELVLDDEGYFRTGDIAELQEDSYVRILGRRRDVFNTIEGTNIFPERIETMLESISLFDQVVLMGDGKAYLTAHIVLRDSKLEGGEDGFLPAEDYPEVYRDAGLRIEALNGGVEAIQQVVAFALYAKPFPVEVYHPVSAGKFYKDRNALVRCYGERTSALYRLDHKSLHLVPPQERRFDQRVNERTGTGTGPEGILGSRRR